MRKKRVVYLRNLYQDFLNKERERTGLDQNFSNLQFRKIKKHWKKYKQILP